MDEAPPGKPPATPATPAPRTAAESDYTLWRNELKNIRERVGLLEARLARIERLLDELVRRSDP